jgi:hypothetical protein
MMLSRHERQIEYESGRHVKKKRLVVLTIGLTMYIGAYERSNRGLRYVIGRSRDVRRSTNIILNGNTTNLLMRQLVGSLSQPFSLICNKL